MIQISLLQIIIAAIIIFALGMVVGMLINPDTRKDNEDIFID